MRVPVKAADNCSVTEGSVDTICESVLKRFSRAYPIPVAAIRNGELTQPLCVNGCELPTVHPTCEQCTNNGHCSTEWSDAPEASCEPQYACCPSGNFVGSIPLEVDGKLVAVFRLVEPGTLPKASFTHRVELLADLLRQSTLSEYSSRPEDRQAAKNNDLWYRPARTGMHPQVQKAVAHIDDNLRDPRLNVAGIARALGINATYLSHIFSETIGTRMSRYIAAHRIQLAKELLATTDWQIKRIAFESGHSNADWFSQVFHAHTGMTPCKYRRHVRSSADPGNTGTAG